MRVHSELPQQTIHAFAVFRFRDLVGLRIVSNRMTLSRWIEQGHFPKPIHLGPNSLAWRVRDVEQWLAARVEKNCA